MPAAPLPKAVNGVQDDGPLVQADGLMVLHSCRHVPRIQARSAAHFSSVQGSPTVAVPGVTQAVCPVKGFTTVQL